MCKMSSRRRVWRAFDVLMCMMEFLGAWGRDGNPMERIWVSRRAEGR